MTRIIFDQEGERKYERGVDHGVLYKRDLTGAYANGYVWNGLTAVNETPTGAESNIQYADNIPYINLKSAEQFAATIEALHYPDEFASCEGSAEPTPGVFVSQQNRETFGFSYRVLVGSALDPDLGEKIVLVYGADAAPSEQNNATVNESPEPKAFSWEITTTPVAVGTIGGTEYKPTAKLTIDSTKVDADAFEDLKDILYGTVGNDPRLPLPAEVIALFDGTITEVETAAPTYNASTDMITIPSVTGVVYYIDGEVVSGEVGPITEDTVVTAQPAAGYRFSASSDDDWSINYA